MKTDFSNNDVFANSVIYGRMIIGISGESN